MAEKSLEEQAEDFLRKHDPLYSSNKKKTLMEHLYYTHRKQARLKFVEIPMSNLSYKQRKECSYYYGGEILSEEWSG
jgi:hypothetical protein